MKILVTDSLAPEGLAVFDNAEGFEVDVKLGLKPDELKKICGDYDGWVIRSGTKITTELIEAAKNLKVIGRAGVGYENIDADAATKRGIVVMNTPGGNNVTTGEHTIAVMMALARHIPQAVASLKSGKWDRNKFVGVELCNKTLGVIGLGNVGRIVAERAAGLRMKVIGYDPFIAADNVARMGVEPGTLEDVFTKSDFITVHVPLTPDTQGMINKAAFAMMKTGVRIINCARGGIVDEHDLAEAIKQGKVAGAALDVYVGRSATQRRHRGGRADGRFSRQGRGPLRGQCSVGESGAFRSLATLPNSGRKARQLAHPNGRRTTQRSPNRVPRRRDTV